MRTPSTRPRRRPRKRSSVTDDDDDGFDDWGLLGLLGLLGLGGLLKRPERNVVIEHFHNEDCSDDPTVGVAQHRQLSMRNAERGGTTCPSFSSPAHPQQPGGRNKTITTPRSRLLQRRIYSPPSTQRISGRERSMIEVIYRIDPTDQSAGRKPSTAEEADTLEEGEQGICQLAGIRFRRWRGCSPGDPRHRGGSRIGRQRQRDATPRSVCPRCRVC